MLISIFWLNPYAGLAFSCHTIQCVVHFIEHCNCQNRFNILAEFGKLNSKFDWVLWPFRI